MPRALAHTAALIVASGASVWADEARAHPASAEGRATSIVVQPIAVVATADLDFGLVERNGEGNGGFATFSQSAALVFSGGTRSGCGAAIACPVPHRARFVVTGESGRAYRVVTPTSLTITGVPLKGTDALPLTLRVDRFSVSGAGPGNIAETGIVGPDGSSTFELGARLSIPVAAAAARYRADVQVIVTYL